MRLLFACVHDRIGLEKLASRVLAGRQYVAKDISFGVGARAAMLQGVNEVADVVKLTMGPRVYICSSPAFSLFAVCYIDLLLCRRVVLNVEIQVYVVI